MSEANKNTPKDFSGFDEMSSKELEEFLYMDSKMPAGATDVDAIVYISKLLAEREKQSQKDRDVRLYEAWATFNNHYRPYSDDEASAYASAYAEEEDENLSLPIRVLSLAAKARRKRRVLRRVACIALLFFGVIIAGSATAYAFGFDVFQVVAEWSSEQFHLSRGDGKLAHGREVQINPELKGLHALLEEYQIKAKLAPTFLPEGFVQVSVDTYVLNGYQFFLASYNNGEKNLVIQITDIKTEACVDETEFEKNDIPPERYVVNGVTHHIIFNMGRYVAVWANEMYECSVGGDIPKDVLETIIDSIYYEE